MSRQKQRGTFRLVDIDSRIAEEFNEAVYLYYKLKKGRLPIGAKKLQIEKAIKQRTKWLQMAAQRLIKRHKQAGAGKP